MKKQILLTTLFLYSAISLSTAQGLFKVIASSGTTTKSSVGVKIGTQLMASDQIIVGAKSYVGLSYSKGGTVQISTAGTYNVKDLETKLLASTKSASQKYADFIIGEVTKSGDANIHKNPYAYQNVTGSVERSLLKGEATEIIVLLPNKNVFIHDKYAFSWLPEKAVKTYIIQIKNSFDELVKTISTQDTTTVIDFKDEKLKNVDFVTVSVNGKEKVFKRPTEFSFTRVDSNDGLNKKWLSFKKGLGENADNDAQKQLDTAVFLEENELILDAKQAYEKAVKLEPTNEILNIAHTQFLLRHKLGMVDLKVLNAKNKE